MADSVIIKISGDNSEFKQALADAGQAGQSSLGGVESAASKVTQTLSSMSNTAGQSLSGMFTGMAANAGAGMNSLIELASKAEVADMKVASLKEQMAQTAASLATVQKEASLAGDELAGMKEDLQVLPQEIARLQQQLQEGFRIENGPVDLEYYDSIKQQIVEYETYLKKLPVELQKQERTNDRLAASVKRLSTEYDTLSMRLQTAEVAAASADTKLQAAAQKVVENTNASTVSLDDFTASSTVTSKMTESLSGSLNTLAQGAFTEVTMRAMQSVRGMDAFGGSTLVASAAARGLVRVLGPIMKVAGGWIALAAAAAYAAYKIWDVQSGAKAAREAIEKLNEVSKEWKETNVKTSFEASKGLGAFGLDKEDFKVPPARDWMAEVTRVWSDGKKETNDIVKEMVGGFTAGSDEMREKLTGIKKTAVSGGFAGDGFLADLDKDMVRLNKIDTDVEKLLKKKKNGLLSDKDKIKLQSLIDERDAISIKYNLEPAKNSGFDKIVQDVEAAMSRGGDPTKTFTDAYAAATQGMGAYTDALNSEYDAQYEILRMSGQLFDAQGNKTQELIALQEWYNQKAEEGTQQYNTALAEASKQTGAFGPEGAYDETAAKLREIQQLMKDAAGGRNNEATEKLATALAGLDETQVVEVTAALVAMKTAAEEANVPMEESAASLLQTLEDIKTSAGNTTNVFKEDLQTDLNTMFGDNLDNEVLEVYATLNTTGLEEPYKAWAEGEHADIIPTIDTATVETSLGSLTVDGLTGKISIVTGDGETFEIQNIFLNPKTGKVNAVTADGKTLDITELFLKPETGHVNVVTADGKTLKIQQLTLNPETGHVEAVTGDGKTVDIDEIFLNPEEGHVEVVTADGKTLTIQKLTLNPETGHVDVVTGDNKTLDITDIFLKPETGHVEVVTADGKLLTIQELTLNPETGHVEGVTADGKKFTIQEIFLDPLTGTVTMVTASGETFTVDIAALDALQGTIVEVTEGKDIKKPTIQLDGEVNVKKVNIDEGVFTNEPNAEHVYLAGTQKFNEGDQGLFTSSNAENLKRYAQALEEFQTASANKDVSGIDAASSALASLDQVLATQLDMGGFEEMVQMVVGGLDQLVNNPNLSEEELVNILETINAINTILATPPSGEVGSTFSDGLTEELRRHGWDVTADTVKENLSTALMTALQMSGIDTSPELTANVENAVGNSIDAVDLTAKVATLKGKLVEALAQSDTGESNVEMDVELRPKVVADESLRDTLATYVNDVDAMLGETMTVFSSTFGNEEGAQVLVTPILPDGTMLDAGQLESYVNGLFAGGTSNILENDDLGLVMGVFSEGTEEENISAAERVAAAFHELHTAQLELASVDMAGVGDRMAAGVTSAAQGSEASAYAAGKNVGQGYVDGMDSKLSAVIAKARQLARAAINTINTTSENASPSKASRRSGRFVGEGFALGISDRVAQAIQASKSLGLAGLSGLDVGSLHMTAALASGSGSSAGYSDLAAMLSRPQDPPGPTYLYIDGKEAAIALAEHSRRAGNARIRRLAKGVGK